MPVSRNAHHTQLYDTPCVRTKSVTRFGVSVLNVVATIDVPTSHHGAERPGSEVLRRCSTAPGAGRTSPAGSTRTGRRRRRANQNHSGALFFLHP